jgi:protein SCO1/2
MQKKPLFSTQTIAVFLVFVCAAIMASLFVFHITHKTTATELAEGNGTYFPVARDIKDFDLVTTDKQPFTQKNLFGHWTLLFFGFTHCPEFCPNTLTVLNKAYDTLHAAHPDMQVVFATLDPESDTLATLEKYTHTFNEQFIGVTGSIQNIRKLQSQFGVYTMRDDTSQNNQLQHTTSIFLINPTGKWTAIFKYGIKPTQLAQAVETSINSN